MPTRKTPERDKRSTKPTAEDFPIETTYTIERVGTLWRMVTIKTQGAYMVSREVDNHTSHRPYIVAQVVKLLENIE